MTIEAVRSTRMPFVAVMLAWSTLVPLSMSAFAQLADGVAPSPVSADTMSVAILPRPERVTYHGPPNCPHRGPGLTSWDPSWIGPDGAVAIPIGVRALVRGNKDIPEDLLIRELSVPAGSELIFDDREASFRVRDIRIAGTLRLGSPECRLKKTIEFVFTTDEDVSDVAVLDQIYARQGLGLVVEPGGVLEIFGSLYQPTWTRLDETLIPGTNVIRLAENVDWREGQEILVVTSARRDYPFLNQNEVRRIQAKLDPRTFVVDTPFDYLHYAGPEYQVEVALLSRDIKFSTADEVVAAAPAFGGHVMAMTGAEARVSGVEIRHFGQQNFLGRYPLHLHRLGDVAGVSYLTDNSIVESNWRCAVIHRTDGAIVSRNVAYDTYGNCFYLEDGTEQNNEISFNLAAGIKIMGDVSDAAMLEIRMAGQEGFTLMESPEFANPADRAAAGFYITNGNNRIFGNAAAGGFAGYSFPNLPEAIGGNAGASAPIDVAISHFDGNTAHSSAYFWPNSGCVYVGGLLESVDDGGTSKLRYKSGRTLDPLLRNQEDRFANVKTFLCEIGLMHWGQYPQVVNLEAWDVGFMAQLFGSGSLQSVIVAGQTGNTANLLSRPVNFYQRGFRFYDTDTRTIFSGIVFREFHQDPLAGARRSLNSCAMISLTHSDQFTPQRMNAMAEIYFKNVDDALRVCNDDTGTLSSRNFNLNDLDGSATRLAGDGLPPGPRIAGSAWTDAWRLSEDCVLNEDWGLWVCPQVGTRNVASVATLPNAGVNVIVYDLDGSELGENWYGNVHYDQAQITGPSETRWHHVFPGGAPSSFLIHAMQVPDDSFVVYSFELSAGETCWVDAAGWAQVADFDTLLTTPGAVYAAESNICFIRIPPANRGFFEAAGLSTPIQTWRVPPFSFTVRTGLIQ